MLISKLIAPLALALTAAPIAAQSGSAAALIPERFHGVWDDTTSDCSIYSDARLRISAGEMVFYESVAKVTSSKADGDGVLRTTMSSGEGETWETTFRLSMKDDRLMMKVTGSRWGPIERKRCPANEG